jgi:hypothetical protein
VLTDDLAVPKSVHAPASANPVARRIRCRARIQVAGPFEIGQQAEMLIQRMKNCVADSRHGICPVDGVSSWISGLGLFTVGATIERFLLGFDSSSHGLAWSAPAT